MSSATVSYPHSELTAHTGQPTADTLRITLDELVANTAAIQTSLGGGQHGHSGLVYSAAEYAAIATPSPAAYIVPAQPMFPTPATLAAAVAADANMTPAIQIVLHQHEQAIVDKANTVETDMRRLLVAAYEPVYFEAFAAAQGKAVGQCTVQELMGHLNSTYGAVRAPEIAQQMAKLQTSYNPAEPIEKYWATSNGVVAFATKHSTKPADTTVINEILSSFERDGHFRDEAKAWRLKSDAKHILATFITAITAVHKLATITAGKAGYHGANAATIAPVANAAASAASAPITPPRKPAAPGRCGK
jgi:hypothetical protein